MALRTPMGARIRGVYRYTLWRTFDEGQGSVAFVMLNPSTADARNNDPTIRRCIGYAQAWGFRRLEVVNLYAFRATHPRDLFAHPAPIGPENDRQLLRTARRSDVVLCAWGSHGEKSARGHQVWQMLAHHPKLAALAITKGGEPAHPLYQRKTSPPRRYLRDAEGASLGEPIG